MKDSISSIDVEKVKADFKGRKGKGRNVRDILKDLAREYNISESSIKKMVYNCATQIKHKDRHSY
jgi:Mor family transcriptional regulator